MTFEERLQSGIAALREADYDRARTLFDRAEDAAASDAEQALVDIHRASIPVLQTTRDADLNVFRANLVRRHSPRHVAVSAYYLVINAVDRNDRATAERYLPTLLQAVDEWGDLWMRLSSYDVAAAVESLRGNHIAAIEYGRVALAEAERYEGDGAVLLRAGTCHNLAYNSLAANEYVEALEYAKQSLPLAEESGHIDLFRQALVTASFAYLCRELLAEADALAVRAMELARGTPLEKYVHYVRGEVARRRGDVQHAAAHFRNLEPFYPEIPHVSEILLSMNVAPFLLPE